MGSNRGTEEFDLAERNDGDLDATEPTLEKIDG